jgi:hypothetical protein
MGAVIAMDC